MANGKSHTLFRLVPKPMSLDDLEWPLSDTVVEHLKPRPNVTGCWCSDITVICSRRQLAATDAYAATVRVTETPVCSPASSQRSSHVVCIRSLCSVVYVSQNLETD